MTRKNSDLNEGILEEVNVILTLKAYKRLRRELEELRSQVQHYLNVSKKDVEILKLLREHVGEAVWRKKLKGLEVLKKKKRSAPQARPEDEIARLKAQLAAKDKALEFAKNALKAYEETKRNAERVEKLEKGEDLK